MYLLGARYSEDTKLETLSAFFFFMQPGTAEWRRGCSHRQAGRLAGSYQRDGPILTAATNEIKRDKIKQNDK